MDWGSELTYVVAALALANFLVVVALALVVSRQEPRRRGDPIRIKQVLLLIAIALSLALMITVFKFI